MLSDGDLLDSPEDRSTKHNFQHLSQMAEVKMTNLPVLLVPSYQGRVGSTQESSRSSAEDLG